MEIQLSMTGIFTNIKQKPAHQLNCQMAITHTLLKSEQLKMMGIHMSSNGLLQLRNHK